MADINCYITNSDSPAIWYEEFKLSLKEAGKLKFSEIEDIKQKIKDEFYRLKNKDNMYLSREDLLLQDLQHTYLGFASRYLENIILNDA